ncbi:MAG: VWA domain-containing protein [Treponema sp.]|jgi:uncharacterized protein YegL|nr:VWA domain-containing protein [Treponema sp.]
MSLHDEVDAIPRRTMVLFFMVDTSGSMTGSKIGAVNAAVEEIIPELKNLSDSNADAQIKVAALEFSSGARWITAAGPVDTEQFRWNYLDASGVTDLGYACKTLNDKLSRKAYMQEVGGSFAPVIFLLSDGGPTDDYEGGLNELKQNKWFQHAIKVAVAIGEDADKTVLEQFTGSPEAILEVHSAAMLKKMIKFVIIRSSEIGSKSADAGDSKTKQQQLNDQVQEMREESVNEDDEW